MSPDAGHGRPALCCDDEPLAYGTKVGLSAITREARKEEVNKDEVC